MKAKAHRHRSVVPGDKRRLQGQALRLKRRHHLEPMAERKYGQVLVADPLESGGKAVPPRVGYLPREPRPRHAMYRKAVIVAVEQRR
jgi:hypothetical protein